MILLAAFLVLLVLPRAGTAGQLEPGQYLTQHSTKSACGATTQNILLASHNLGLGGFWLGEIINKRSAVEEILKVPEKYELMAVVTLGYPDEKPKQRSCKPLSQLIFHDKYST